MSDPQPDINQQRPDVAILLAGAVIVLGLLFCVLMFLVAG